MSGNLTKLRCSLKLSNDERAFLDDVLIELSGKLQVHSADQIRLATRNCAVIAMEMLYSRRHLLRHLEDGEKFPPVTSDPFSAPHQV